MSAERTRLARRLAAAEVRAKLARHRPPPDITPPDRLAELDNRVIAARAELDAYDAAHARPTPEHRHRRDIDD